MTGEATLTATVQDGSGYVPGSPDTASTRIRVADPAVTAWFEKAAYTFDEAAGDATVAVILRTRCPMVTSISPSTPGPSPEGRWTAAIVDNDVLPTLSVANAEAAEGAL